MCATGPAREQRSLDGLELGRSVVCGHQFQADGAPPAHAATADPVSAIPA